MPFLGDLAGLSAEEVKEHIRVNYGGSRYNEKQEVVVDLDDMVVLIAYESVGNYDCDSFFLIQDQEGNFYEVNGSHCSCYGFEGQWFPEETSIAAIHHRVNNGSLFYPGFNRDDGDSHDVAREFINRLYATEQIETYILRSE